ncbi:hypothetical protein [Roseofilum casamattae]|uniref:PIN domain-containing protein n=1 Tax=Roseofilum casamattae BLCC-M143 TaxID=3022442 RepID=A0ABT7C0V6_9CYAN|nr:hypothetical protein [Roseofilum casamattae]MDJ1185085.1 hypothetical protein [Roseofilum casamattae BLCC-M143]
MTLLSGMNEMNILIDGCVFAYSDYLEIAKFWESLIPRLVASLEGHRVYVLNRDVNAIFPELAVQNLFAPAPDFDRSSVEVCRLSALCKELDIDVFISSYNTSPGSQAKSLFVLEPSPSAVAADSPLDESSVRLSRERSLKMASGYFLLSEESGNVLKSEVELAPDEVIWTELISDLEIDWESLAQHVARAMNELFDSKIDGQVSTRIESEEMAICREVEQLRRKAETESKDKAFYPIYDPNFKPKQTSILMRGYLALTQPERYGEFAGRIYQWMKNKVLR